jgi:flagellar basal-body rod modification protein FlgD
MSVTGVQTPWAVQQNQYQSATVSGIQQVDKQEFLMLLVAQLRNQDPSKPMEDREFVTQLAQFNTLEQMQQMNRTMSAVSEMTVLGQLASFVGKQVSAVQNGTTVEGVVSGVTLVDGTPRLIVGDKQIDIQSVFAISAPPATEPEATPPPPTPQPVG